MKKLITGFCVLFLIFGCATNTGSGTKSSDAGKKSAEAAGPQPETTLVDDFESDESLTLRFTYDDATDGGTSTIVPASIPEEIKDKQVAMEHSPGKGAEGSDGWFKMTGKVTTAFTYGYAGLGVKLNKDAIPVDLSEYTGIMLWAKGDGKKYRLQFVSKNVEDFCYYNFPFKAEKEWTLVKVPFKFIMQETWGAKKGKTESLQQVTALQIQTIGQPIDSFELNVDSIALYKE